MGLKKSDVVTGLAALVVAGPAAMVVSPFAYRCLKAKTKRPRIYWFFLGWLTLPIFWAPLIFFLPTPKTELKAPESPASEPQQAPMTPGQKFLKAKLAELDSLRKTQEFREYKFSMAGPYANWPKEVEKEAEQMGSLTMWEKVQGLGSLSALSYLYLQTNGFDDVGKPSDLEWIKKYRQDIEEVLRASQ